MSFLFLTLGFWLPARPLITCFCSVSGFFTIFSLDEISVLFVDLTVLGLVAQGLRFLLVGVAMLHHFSY